MKKELGLDLGGSEGVRIKGAKVAGRCGWAGR